MKPSSALSLLFSVTVWWLGSVANAQNTSDYFGGLNHDAYLSWSNSSSFSYVTSVFLKSSADDSEGVAVHWTLDDTHIYLAVAARATGWVGFGIAESGGMRGADIVLFEAESKKLTDTHVLDDLIMPITDISQDWELIGSKTEGGFIMFEAKRLLDTGDTQDRHIINDSTLDVAAQNVIAAWGNSTTVSYHSPSSRLRNTIRFYGNSSTDELTTFERQVRDEAEGSFLLQAMNYSIKANDTEYAHFCLTSANLTSMGVPIDTDLHTIGILPFVDTRSKKYVHHFVLHGSISEECGDDTFINIAYVWAPGEGPLNLPPNVGGLLGSNGYKSLMLQIHYNNPTLDTGILDNSGVEVFYTSKKRKYDLGVLQIGDPFVYLRDQLVGDGLVQHTFDCPGSCSSASLNQSVTVIREYLHMHQTGERMYNNQYRNGKLLRRGVVDFFDFDQSGSYSTIQPPFDIISGDSFQTSCYYDAGPNTTFGLGSSNEMCMAFLFYYPRQVSAAGIPYTCGYGSTDILLFPECDTNWTKLELTSVDQLERTFGMATATYNDTSTSDPTTEPTTLTPSAGLATSKPSSIVSSTTAPTISPSPNTVPTTSKPSNVTSSTKSPTSMSTTPKSGSWKAGSHTLFLCFTIIFGAAYTV